MITMRDTEIINVIDSPCHENLMKIHVCFIDKESNETFFDSYGYIATRMLQPRVLHGIGYTCIVVLPQKIYPSNFKTAKHDKMTK